MIDYLGQRKTQEQDLRNLLSSQKAIIPSNVANTRSTIEAGREKFLGRLPNLTTALPGGVAPDTTRVRRNLSQNLNRNLSGRKFNEERARLNIIYDNAIRLADEYGMDRRQAEAFARGQLAKAQERKFQTKYDERERQHGRKLDDIQASAVQRGSMLADQYQPSTDFSSAMLRVLLGAGTSLGTSLALGRGGTKTPMQTNPNAYTGVGPQQNLGYYPEKPSFLY